MCQSKELGGLRCSSHIKENIDNNNFAHTNLVIDEARKLGHNDAMDKLEADAKYAAEWNANGNDATMKAWEKQVKLSMAYDAKAERILSIADKTKSVDATARAIVEGNDKYQVIRASYEKHKLQYEEVVRNGNVFQRAIARRQMSKRKKETMEQIGKMVASAKQDAAGILQHGNLGKTSFGQEMQSVINVAKENREQGFQKAYKASYQNEIKKRVSEIPEYNKAAKSIDDNPTRKSLTIARRQKEYSQQYSMTAEYSRELDTKIGRAKENGRKEQLLRLLVEKESVAASRTKEQFDNIKASKSPKRRSQLTELKEKHAQHVKHRDHYAQQHVEFIQEQRAHAA